MTKIFDLNNCCNKLLILLQINKCTNIHLGLNIQTRIHTHTHTQICSCFYLSISSCSCFYLSSYSCLCLCLQLYFYTNKHLQHVQWCQLFALTTISPFLADILQHRCTPWQVRAVTIHTKTGRKKKYSLVIFQIIHSIL